MTQELTQLQAKYIAGVESMGEADVRRYLTLLEADYGAEFRERRIYILIQRIRAIERIARAEQRRKDDNVRLTEQHRQFTEITDGWIAKGATVRTIGDGARTIWDYGETELYRHGGEISTRKTVPEMLADAQRIDEEFQELLRKGSD